MLLEAGMRLEDFDQSRPFLMPGSLLSIVEDRGELLVARAWPRFSMARSTEAIRPSGGKIKGFIIGIDGETTKDEG